MLLILAAGLAACSDGVSLPLDAQAGDLIVVLSTVDGRATPQIFVHDPGKVLQVDSDAERPIFTWVLPKAAQVDEQGQALSAEQLALATARLAGDSLDPVANTGSCERCNAPTLSAPIVVHPGDSCPLPSFSPGGIWKAELDYGCRAAKDSNLCPEGSVDDQAAIEEARRQIRIDRPGTCACSVASTSPSLSELEIVPFSPAQSPVPMTTFADNDAGEVAAFGHSGAFMIRPDETEATVTLYSDIAWTVTTAVGLRSGDFLVTGQGFNTGPFPEQVFHRFSADANSKFVHEVADVRSPARPQRMKYLSGTDDEYPLYFLGSSRTIFGSDPALFACTASGENCQPVGIAACMARPALRALRDAVVNDNGFGLAVAEDALYYKTPNPTGTPRLSINDTWRCSQPEGPFPSLDPEGEAIDFETFRTIGVSKDRLFLCGETSPPQCEARRAVVITATASANDPNWRVAYLGPPNSQCRDFVPQADGTGILLAGGQLVEFNDEGHITQEGHVTETFGPVTSFYRAWPLSPGRVVATTSHNRVWVGTSSQAFAPIYGSQTAPRRTYRAAVARPGGGFIAFGATTGPVLVDALGLSWTELEDANGALSGAQIYAVARAEGSATPDSLPLILGGKKDGLPYLIKATVTGSGLQDVMQYDVPEETGTVTKIADLGGSTLVATLDTRLFILKDDSLKEVDLDWDDPFTDGLERRPAPPEDRCSGGVGQLNLLKSVFGSEGTGWAAGTNLLFQVTPGAQGPRAERYNLPPDTDTTAGQARCSAQTTMAARTNVLGGGGIKITQLKMFELETESEPRRGETAETMLDPRRQRFTPISPLDFETLTDPNLRLGLAVAVLPDRGSFGSASEALVLNNGFIMRVGSGQPRVEYLRVPFSPQFAVQDEAGTVLFGGAEGQLAVGAPVIGGSGR